MFLYHEDDPHVLLSLEICEKAFHSIREEEALLVDYAGFPMKLVDLLHRCLSEAASSDPRYRAELTYTSNTKAQLKILESNDFKDLSHITLHLIPGSDTDIKQFLAFRLQEAKSQCQQLQETIASSRNEVRSLHTEITDLKSRAIENRESWDKKLQERDLQLSKHQNVIKVSEVQITELSEALEAARRAYASAELETASMRDSLSNTSAELKSVKNDVKSKRKHVETLEQSLDAQRRIAEQQASHCLVLEEALHQAESDCEDLSKSLQAHESRAREALEEVVSANQIIESLTTHLESCKQTMHIQNAANTKLKSDLEESRNNESCCQQDVNALGEQLGALTNENTRLQGQVSELKQEMGKKEAKLISNQQMIRWLNSQLTDAQVGKFRVSAPSPDFLPTKCDLRSWGTHNTSADTLMTRPQSGFLSPSLSTDTRGVEYSSAKAAAAAAAKLAASFRI